MRAIRYFTGFVCAFLFCLGFVYAQSWSTPLVWTTGQTVTAAQLNAYISDNTSVLRAGGIAITSQAANDLIYASSSTQFARLATGTGVLTASGAAPSWSTTPTLTGTNFTGIPETGITDGTLLARFADATWTLSTSGFSLISNTSDASDTKSLGMSGGGAAGSDSRGAYSFVYGNEHATEAGNAYVVAGNIAGARVRLYAVGDNVANVTETAILPGATATYALGGASDRWSSFHSVTGNFSGAVTLGDATADVHVLNGRLNSGTAQPGFLAYNSSSDAAVADGSTVDVDTEITDKAGDFAADTFTAPVTGDYLLCGHMTATPSSGPSAFGLRLVVTGTSAHTYYLSEVTGSDEDSHGDCVVAPMTATDTAKLQTASSGITLIVGGGATVVTYFSGRLLP